MTILKKKPTQYNKMDALRESISAENEKTTFTLRLPATLHRQFKVKAAVDDIDMCDVLIEAIRKYVGKN